jgi:hypothetical protein
MPEWHDWSTTRVCLYLSEVSSVRVLILERRNDTWVEFHCLNLDMSLRESHQMNSRRWYGFCIGKNFSGMESRGCNLELLCLHISPSKEKNGKKKLTSRTFAHHSTRYCLSATQPSSVPSSPRSQTSRILIRFTFVTSRLGSKQYLGRDSDEDIEKNCDKRVEAKCHFCRNTSLRWMDGEMNNMACCERWKWTNDGRCLSLLWETSWWADVIEGVVIHLHVKISACRCWFQYKWEWKTQWKNGRTVWVVQSSYCFVVEDAANLPEQ